jgi:citrate lyase subunit beta-like protein
MIRLLLSKVLFKKNNQAASVTAVRYMQHRRSRTVESRYVPRRALMYVPGSDERKLAKIPSLKADCICLDCEDGVAFTAKDKARANIQELLSTKTQEFFGKSECSLRVNSIPSGLCHIDVETILEDIPDNFMIPSAIHLPKVNTPEDIDEFAYLFNGATSRWLTSSSTTTIGLIMFIESAQSLMALPRICERAVKLKEKSALVPEALVFGRYFVVHQLSKVNNSN